MLTDQIYCCDQKFKPSQLKTLECGLVNFMSFYIMYIQFLRLLYYPLTCLNDRTAQEQGTCLNQTAVNVGHKWGYIQIECCHLDNTCMSKSATDCIEIDHIFLLPFHNCKSLVSQ